MAKSRVGREHGVLHLIVPAASIAVTLLTWYELQLEFDEVVLLVWTIVLPLAALIALILPVLRASPELRLYTFLFFIVPTALLHFFSDFVDFNEVSLLMICVAPVVSLIRVLHLSLKATLPAWNTRFWAERLPELSTLLCVGVLPVVACAEFQLLAFDDAALIFFCVFAPIALTVLNSPVLKAARDAVRPRPHPRAAPVPVGSACTPHAPLPSRMTRCRPVSLPPRTEPIPPWASRSDSQAVRSVLVAAGEGPLPDHARETLAQHYRRSHTTRPRSASSTAPHPPRPPRVSAAANLTPLATPLPRRSRNRTARFAHTHPAAKRATSMRRLARPPLPAVHPSHLTLPPHPHSAAGSAVRRLPTGDRDGRGGAALPVRHAACLLPLQDLPRQVLRLPLVGDGDPPLRLLRLGEMARGPGCRRRAA